MPLSKPQTPPQPGTSPRARRRFLLASRSPRRQELLREAGLQFEARHPGFDDADLTPGRVTPLQWVAALAYLKAAAGAMSLTGSGPAATDARVSDPPNQSAADDPLVLGADTACIQDGHLIGTPRDSAEARAMLRALRNNHHDVITGVALIDPATGRRLLFADTARVEVGGLTDEQIDAYIDSGGWQGKAGAYNLRERLDAGWPIRYEGDPATVMGLPVQVLLRRLQRWPDGGPSGGPTGGPSGPGGPDCPDRPDCRGVAA